MDCSKVRALREEVAYEAVGVLVHHALPGMIVGSEEDIGLQGSGGFPVRGELLAVVVGVGWKNSRCFLSTDLPFEDTHKISANEKLYDLFRLNFKRRYQTIKCIVHNLLRLF